MHLSVLAFFISSSCYMFLTSVISGAAVPVAAEGLLVVYTGILDDCVNIIKQPTLMMNFQNILSIII